MSSLTSFLKLFKWDPKTDGSQKFNIPKALNENIDKIEANASAVNTALVNKSNIKHKTGILRTKGWYRVARFNLNDSNHAFSNSLIDIHNEWNNTSGQSSVILISNANATSNLTLLSSTERKTIDKIRLIHHPDEENQQRVCLDIHYNVAAKNNVIVQIHDNNYSTQIIDFKPVEETIEGETVLSTLTLDTYNLNQAIGTLSSLTTTNKTSLVNAINELNTKTTESIVTGVEYATNEYIDNKRVYRKRVNFGELPNATRKSVAHGLSDVTFTKIEGIASNYTGTYTPLTFASTNVTSAISLFVDNTNITITTGADRSGFSAYVDLYYTKN